jgi:hypothetical protein
MDFWKRDNQYEKPGIIRKKASCPFWLNWQVVLEPTSPSFNDAQRLLRIDEEEADIIPGFS